LLEVGINKARKNKGLLDVRGKFATVLNRNTIIGDRLKNDVGSRLGFDLSGV